MQTAPGTRQLMLPLPLLLTCVRTFMHSEPRSERRRLSSELMTCVRGSWVTSQHGASQEALAHLLEALLRVGAGQQRKRAALELRRKATTPHVN